ncbi:EF-hand domain-containing protein [Phenylobacterium aquaticum]|uniref:EF-hand domain-containing protein n=1 Tax=Phenylobacterium aquaticum TaxID=1763816 RepID=UPI0026F14C46|nr:EF-hand domain-containing protein [Phenylobacterium aquaticum]
MRTFILAAVAALALAGTAQAQMMGPPDPAAIFKKFDANNDGAITKDEWVAAGRPAERFDLVDADHDGKVTQAELTAAIQKMMQARQGQ